MNERPSTAEVLDHWFLARNGVNHEVMVTDRGWRRRVVWLTDGEVVAERTTSEERVVLTPPETGAGARPEEVVRVWLPSFIGPTRRVCLFVADGKVGARERAEAGIGGREFVPEPGSKAARRQEWIKANPTLYTLRQTAMGVARVVVPLLLAYLAINLAFTITWPDWLQLPRIPWPDWNLPRIPWPDISFPTIPWPDWWPPAWLVWVAENAKYIVPIVVAFVLARAEIRRRRKAERQQSGNTAAPDEAPGDVPEVDDADNAGAWVSDARGS